MSEKHFNTAEMSRFWNEHLAEARDTWEKGEAVGVLHGLLLEGAERIATLEAQLAAVQVENKKLRADIIFVGGEVDTE